LLSLVLVAAVFVFGYQQSGNTRIDEIFADLCANARGRVVPADSATGKAGAPPVKHHVLSGQCFARPPGEDIQDLVTAFTTRILPGVEEPIRFTDRLDILLSFPELPRTLKLRDYGSVVKAYGEELVRDFRSISWSLLSTVGLLSLASLIPGVAGLIYRRNFWGWFFASFMALFSLNAISPIVPVHPMRESGAILLWLVSQLIILFIALRLRRFSSRQAMVLGTRPRLFNAGLLILLVVIAAACVMGWGPGNWPHEKAADASWIWSFLGSGIQGFVARAEFLLIGLPVVYALFRRTNHWPYPGAKNIVLCLDGTSNTPDQVDQGRPAQTNVFKLFEMLKADKPARSVASIKFGANIVKKYAGKQIALYYSGVGNRYDNSPIGQLLGGAMGLGAADVVGRAYLDAVSMYRPGDRIFIFGFSRGAAIARLLARAIDSRGVPKTIWTLRALGRHWIVWKSASRGPAVPVSVLGCWDTVGSFGIAKTVAGIDLQRINMFLDLNVPDNVNQAYHMVALDERRREFRPTLMDPDPIDPTRIVEVWFSGDHANIGGGWATSKLSDVTLDFLLKQVSSGYAYREGMQPGDETWGLHLSARIWDGGDKLPGMINPDSRGQVRQWISDLYVYEDRKLPSHAVISETVFERMTRTLPLYAPQSLFDHHRDLNAKRETVNAEIASLTATQSLSPAERDAMIGFKDNLRIVRWPGSFGPKQDGGYVAPDPARRLPNATDGRVERAAEAATEVTA
jgi:hypothetical protein